MSDDQATRSATATAVPEVAARAAEVAQALQAQSQAFCLALAGLNAVANQQQSYITAQAASVEAVVRLLTATP